MTILNNRSLYLDVWETVGTGGRMERRYGNKEKAVCATRMAAISGR